MLRSKVKELRERIAWLEKENERREQEIRLLEIQQSVLQTRIMLLYGHLKVEEQFIKGEPARTILAKISPLKFKHGVGHKGSGGWSKE